MLQVENLSFGYHGTAIAHGVSFDLRAGEVLCLLGANGSGKTTLFKTLLGLIPAIGGRVRIASEDVAGLSRRRMAQLVAYVPQAHNTFFPFSVREVVLMGCTARIGLFGVPSAADHRAVDAALGSVGILHLAERSYTEISGGERQLVLVARALAQAPLVLVMDEPSASLDFGNQVRVLRHIRAVADTGVAVALSTHDPDHAFLCADRVALLHEGALVALGAPEDTITAAALRQLYGVEVVVTRLPETGRSVCSPSLAH